MRRVKHTTWSGHVERWQRLTRREREEQAAICLRDRHQWVEVIGVGVVCLRCLKIDLAASEEAAA